MTNRVRVGVVIPVGPTRRACGWLPEALASVDGQTYAVDEIVIVDDMHNVGEHQECSVPGGTVIRNFWLAGVPGAFNIGLSAAFAQADLVVMLGADDWLEPDAVQHLVDRFERNNRKDGYYHFTIRYSDTGELQTLPNNCAAVTPGLWRTTGGFPTESSVGACDTMFISILLKHFPATIRPVADGVPLYNYRRHNDSDTGTRPVELQGPIHIVRDVLTTHWKKPAWGRFE